jgi:hypothetical protein
MKPKDELNELHEFKVMVQSRVFQKYLMEPIKKELDGLKTGYECESVKEMAELKGKYKGLKFIIDILKQSENKIKNLTFEIDNTEG